MDSRNKWEFYVHKMYEAEIKVKNAINAYRDYKEKIANYRYERPRTKNEQKMFDVSPNHFIDEIFAAKARVTFVETKIEFYKTITLEGETLANRKKLSLLEKTCAELLAKHGQKLAYIW